MEVVGPRELGFFPGTCRGLAFEGFVYSSEAGARAVEMEVDRNLLPHGEKLKQKFVSYYNGGGVYVDARKLTERGVEILASYTEKIHVKSGEGKAAIVYRKIGEGAAILTGPHPEYEYLVFFVTRADFLKVLGCKSQARRQWSRVRQAR